jgi:broad specificity phosphatase PhoE
LKKLAPEGYLHFDYNCKKTTESKVLLLRHGNSKINKRNHFLWRNKSSIKEREKIWTDPAYIDAELSEFGELQAKSSSEMNKDLDIKYVIVSSLRRSLQTAYLFTKDR